MQIELTVAYVGFGGNIGEGQYFFSYSPNVIMVKNKDESLNFSFSTATAKDFAMHEILTTDANNQFGKATKSTDNRSMQIKDNNTNSQLTLLSIIVHDKSRNLYISCDPQVLNVPDLE